MRILLIATNMHRRLMSRMNAQPAPIGLAYIAGHLDPSRHDLKILDLMFSEDYLGGIMPSRSTLRSRPCIVLIRVVST